MKNPKPRKSETSIKKTSEPRKRNKKQSSDNVEEILGVHIISEADIKNHFGISEEKSDSELES